MPNNKLDVPTLENWLWDAACKIRGEIDAPKYKDYILPLIFLKRLSDVFEDEVLKLSESYGDKVPVEKLLAEDHSLVRFYLPPESRWHSVARQATGVGQYLTDVVRSIARENPKLSGVIDIVDFNATQAGQRIISDERSKMLIDVLGRYRLGLKDVEPDILGRAYEYLLRKFAEGSGQSAGARVKLISDGDIAASLQAALPETGVDVLMGVGGTPEGVLSAAAILCIGGAIQCKGWPRDEKEKEAAIAAGVDLDRVYKTEDLIDSDDVFFAATGVSSSELLKGVRYTSGGAQTQSLAMRSRSGTIRWIDAWHDFGRLDKLSSIKLH
jgi:hypothetical protein